MWACGRIGVWGEAADERELPPSQGLRRGGGDEADEREPVPTGRLYFFLRCGAVELMSRGVPRLGFERGTFSVLNLWPIQYWWVRSGGMKGKARSSTI